LAPPVLIGSTSVGKGKGEGEGAIALLAKVYREKGVAGWYKGLGAQIIKAVLCQGKFRLSRLVFSAWTILLTLLGILFVSKDQFESYTILLLALLARLRARIPVARLAQIAK